MVADLLPTDPAGPGLRGSAPPGRPGGWGRELFLLSICADLVPLVVPFRVGAGLVLPGADSSPVLLLVCLVLRWLAGCASTFSARAGHRSTSACGDLWDKLSEIRVGGLQVV